MVSFNIDLSDILGDEDGPESLAESVKRQIVEQMAVWLKKEASIKIEAAIHEMRVAAIKAAIEERLPGIVDDLFNLPYTPVSKYGSKGEPTTFRDELLKSIVEQMVYKPETHLDRENVFTKAVRAVVTENVGKFRADFDKKVNEKFTAAAMEYAANAVKKKLGIS